MNASRLDIRLSKDTKELIQRAAVLRNKTLTQFVVETLSEESDKVLSEHAQVQLSNRDRDLFLRALDSPPKPNKALRAAAAKYKKQVST